MAQGWPVVSGFLLRKLYADLVTPDGQVVVVYLGWLSVAGLRTAYAAIESYLPDGTRQVIRGRPDAAQPRLRADGSTEYTVGSRDGRTFRLVHHDALPTWHPAGPPISPRVRWHVAVPYARASGSWGEATTPVLSGCGYSDWVQLHRPPRMLGLRRLQWGRIHLPGRTIVFNTVDHASGGRWTRLAEWTAAGEPAVLTVDGAPQPDGWKVPAPGGPVVLTPVRVLHAGEPLDRDRFPKPLERWTSRAANGPAHEVRWLSRATSADGADGMALHESVEFGRVRTASA